jgi:hypothetical protein
VKLENEATTVREPSLEGDKRLVFYFVGSVTMRQLIKVVHGVQFDAGGGSFPHLNA